MRIVSKDNEICEDKTELFLLELSTLLIYKGKWIKDNPKCCQLNKDNHEAVKIVLNHHCFREFFFIFYKLKIATKVCFLLGDDFYVLSFIRLLAVIRSWDQM